MPLLKEQANRMTDFCHAVFSCLHLKMFVTGINVITIPENRK